MLSNKNIISLLSMHCAVQSQIFKISSLVVGVTSFFTAFDGDYPEYLDFSTACAVQLAISKRKIDQV